MTLDRREMGSMPFIVTRGALPEPWIGVPRRSLAFILGFGIGALAGVVMLVGMATLMLRYGADEPYRVAIVRATP